MGLENIIKRINWNYEDYLVYTEGDNSLQIQIGYYKEDDD